MKHSSRQRNVQDRLAPCEPEAESRPAAESASTEQGISSRVLGGYLLSGTLVAALALWLGAVGCDTGSPTGGTQIQGVLQSAEPLSEFDPNTNRYRPFYRTVDLETPRYLHRAFTHSNGFVVAVGGSDERGLSALDTLEMYDQSVIDPDVPPVESLTGIWLDTNFEGDPITLLNGPRVLFTATELSTGQIVVIGGSTNVGAGMIHSTTEIFDMQTRMFTTLEESDMVMPRFRHRASLLPTGDLMITGGQILTTVTVIDEMIPEGQPGRERQEQRFPSTGVVEVFTPTDLDFQLLTLLDQPTQAAELQTRRGRSDHIVARIAGSDNRLNTGDDPFLVTAGYQTLSAVSGLAPRGKSPGAVGRDEADGQTSIEVFDPSTNIFTLIASVKLDNVRINGGQAVNLGDWNDFTPDGVQGMGNALLFTHGNADVGCPITLLGDKVVIADYTPGAGPANGLQLFEIRDEQFVSLFQNGEYVGHNIPPQGPRIMGGGGRLDSVHQRCATNIVTLPRPLATSPGVDDQVTWAFSLMGVDIFPVPGGCVYNSDSPYMLTAGVFDPFFNLRQAVTNGIDPRNLTTQRRVAPENYLGILGYWFTLDGELTANLEDIGTTPLSRWPQNNGRSRIYPVIAPVAGVDGRIGSFDDRLLIIGGGDSYTANGGEPTAPSSEIFLPPGSSAFGQN